MGIVNEPVEDSIGISRVADKGVPFVDRDLAGEDGRAAPVAFLEDLVEVTTGTGVKGFEAPIVEDEELDTGGPAQDQIVVRIDPLAIGELLKQSAVEAAWGPVIDVLDAGLLAQSGIAQPGGKPLVAAMGELAVDQQPEPVGMGERGGFVGSFEFGKGLSHAGKA